MDTISRENNSYLPIAGVAVGLLALLLSIIALVSNTKLSKKVPEGLADSIAKIDVMEGEIRSAASAAERAGNDIRTLSNSSQNAFNAAGAQIQDLRGEVDKLKEGMKKPAVAGKGGSKEPVVAGPGEYVVKAQDSGMKIAKANGCSLSDLMAVNPGVNWSKLHAGQKIKLPAKK
ncbi:MAG: LysM domain-containing protein [Nibricoccus sp.]